MQMRYQDVSVLVVEDDDVDFLCVERCFRRRKLPNPIQRARDGMEALEVLKSNGVRRPNIILLDINMPKMDGLELLSAIRQDAQLHDLVVFMLTTSKSDSDLYQAYYHNVAGYIVKSELDQDFNMLADMLDNYWRVVFLPKETGS